MKKLHIHLMMPIIAVFIFGGNNIFAQASRTWVSGVGDDVNPCSRTAPCKTFAGAFSKTAAGGEISVLNPGNYGSIIISKAITLRGDGILGSIIFSAGNGITVNAAATDVVTIHGITFNGVGTGSTAIQYNSGGKLHIEDCAINGFTSAGISATLAGKGLLSVKNTSITATTVSTGTGLNLTSSADTLAVSLDHVSLQGLSVGLSASSNVVATIANSIITKNTTAVLANNNGNINLESCMITNNTTGINSVSANSTIRLSNNNISDNTTALSANAGKIISFGNNKAAGNTNPSAPAGVLSTF